MLASTGTFAARPFVADDARLVEARACQLESYYRHPDGMNELGAVPACNPTGNLELSVGGSRVHEDGSSSHVLAQAKTVLVPVQSGRWGTGLAIGFDEQLAGDRRGLRSAYVNVPFTLSLRNDALQFLVNAGAERDVVRQQTHGTYAVAADFALSANLAVVGEVFGNHRDPPAWQTGVRVSLLPSQVEVAAALSAPFGSPDRVWSVVLRVVSPPLW